MSEPAAHHSPTVLTLPKINRNERIVLSSCSVQALGLILVMEVKRNRIAQFGVLLGGELLCGSSTRWKLSWCCELARSFPVRRPGVNQGWSQQDPPPPQPPYLHLLFFYDSFSYKSPHTAESTRNAHYSFWFFISSPCDCFCHFADRTSCLFNIWHSPSCCIHEAVNHGCRYLSVLTETAGPVLRHGR